jgi:hypothetical protein
MDQRCDRRQQASKARQKEATPMKEDNGQTEEATTARKKI